MKQDRDKCEPSKKYSVVVPLHNEEEIFGELYARLRNALSDIGEPYEIVFVDDGSRDSSGKLIADCAASDRNVVAVKLSRNFGQENAIVAGIKCSRGKEIILIDGDLQDPPEFIRSLVHKKNEGFSIVNAIKAKREDGIVRRFLTNAFYRFMYFLTKNQFPINAGTFSIFDREIGEKIVDFPENNKYISGIRAFVGFRQAGLTYDRESRKGGKAKSTFQLLRMGLNALVSFSLFPLRLFILIGGIACMTNMVVIIIMLVKYFLIGPTKGSNTWLTAYALLNSTIIIFILIAVSEYVGRMHFQVKGRPDYIIESVTRDGASVS